MIVERFSSTQKRRLVNLLPFNVQHNIWLTSMVWQDTIQSVFSRAAYVT